MDHVCLYDNQPFGFQALFEPRHEKTCVPGFRPGKTQTGLLRYRDYLEA